MLSQLNELRKALLEIGILNYSVIYVYSDLRDFRLLYNKFPSKQIFLKTLLELFQDLKLTIVMPTFSYTSSGIYDLTQTQCKLGALNSFIVSYPEVIRSEHPIFSFASIGTKSNIVSNVGKKAFGEDSLHARLRQTDSAFLHLGHKFQSGNTIIHHIEELNAVPYRYEKVFDTKVFNRDTYIGTGYSAYVRKLDNPNNNYAFSYEKPAHDLSKSSLIKSHVLFDLNTSVALMPVSEVFNLLNCGLKRDPNYFLKIEQ